MQIFTRKLPRQDLAAVFPDHKTLVAFENLQTDVTGTGDALTTAGFIVTSADDNLGSERVLTPSSNIDITDDGPGAPITLDLTDTGVTADAYGDASSVIQITVDAKGRVLQVQQFALNSDNVAEGSTHLFFTDARARSAISGANQIDYDSATGVIDTTGDDATTTRPIVGLSCTHGVITSVSEAPSAFTGTVSPVTAITVANGIVTAVS